MTRTGQDETTMCRHVFARRFQHGRGTTNEALRSQGLSSGYVIQDPRVISHLFLQDLFKTLDWGFRNPSILYSNGMGREKVGSASRINAADSTCFDRRTPYGKHETHTLASQGSYLHVHRPGSKAWSPLASLSRQK